MLVSIPSGTIKSIWIQSARKATPKFQFLLVRLKVVIDVPDLMVITKFQFLLVRLKDFLDNLETEVDVRFNSFWYD